MSARHDPAAQRQTAPRTLLSAPWCTVVWDDAINLMDYVVEVFRRHFGYDRTESEALMLEVHQSGRAVVSTGQRERMEADALAMHAYGLHATLERVG